MSMNKYEIYKGVNTSEDVMDALNDIPHNYNVTITGIENFDILIDREAKRVYIDDSMKIAEIIQSICLQEKEKESTNVTSINK